MVIQNKKEYALVREDPLVKKELAAKRPSPIEAEKNDSHTSSDDLSPAHLVVRKMRNESSVTRLSREMVRDYMKAKDRVRHFTPDLGSRRIRFNRDEQTKQKVEDRIELILEDEERSRLEFVPKPKFRSAMNTPYQSFEKQQLRQIIALEREAEEQQQ